MSVSGQSHSAFLPVSNLYTKPPVKELDRPLRSDKIQGDGGVDVTGVSISGSVEGADLEQASGRPIPVAVLRNCQGLTNRPAPGKLETPI